MATAGCMDVSQGVSGMEERLEISMPDDDCFQVERYDGSKKNQPPQTVETDKLVRFSGRKY
jgi:hypothetical protein